MSRAAALKPRRRFNLSMISAGVLGALLFLAALALLVRVIVPDVHSEVRADRAGEAEALTSAKAEVAGAFPNAVALSFGKISINWVGDDPAVCGHVDVEEPQDAFEGAERFIYFDGQLVMEELDGTDATIVKWKDLCDAY